MMKTGARGIALIKHFEGLRLKPYQCSADVWTIGYGHTSVLGTTPKVGPESPPISEAQAETILHRDLGVIEQAINRCVTAPVNQHQYDAIASWVFNLGEANMAASTWLARLNAGDYVGAAEAMTWWNKAGGKVLAGLVRRREAEKALFLEPPLVDHVARAKPDVSGRVSDGVAEIRPKG